MLISYIINKEKRFKEKINSKWNLTMADGWNCIESGFWRHNEDGSATHRNHSNVHTWEEAWCFFSSHHHPLSPKIKLGCGACCSGPFEWNEGGRERSHIKTEWMWMDPEIVILRGVGQRKTDIVRYWLHVESKKMVQMKLFTKQKQHHRFSKWIYGYHRMGGG